MIGVTHRRGNLLARGNTSDLFSWTPTSVAKVLQPHIPVEWAAAEAEIADLVHQTGLPVPAVETVATYKGRPAIVFERVDGDVMWDRMVMSPREAPALIAELVRLQTEIHSVVAPRGLPVGLHRLTDKVKQARHITAVDRMRALRVLRTLPGGTALCHGDMHPRNVIMSKRGMVVVDWFDAASGPTTADMVRSSLLMRPTATGPHPSPHLEGVTHGMLERLHREYLTLMMPRCGADVRQLAAWEAVLAVARLAEPVPIIEQVPLRRHGTLEEVASVVVWLLSPESSYLTGENIHVSGGI